MILTPRARNALGPGDDIYSASIMLAESIGYERTRRLIEIEVLTVRSHSHDGEFARRVACD
jgi:hypothetical protein